MLLLFAGILTIFYKLPYYAPRDDDRNECPARNRALLPDPRAAFPPGRERRCEGSGRRLPRALRRDAAAHPQGDIANGRAVRVQYRARVRSASSDGELPPEGPACGRAREL